MLRFCQSRYILLLLFKNLGRGSREAHFICSIRPRGIHFSIFSRAAPIIATPITPIYQLPQKSRQLLIAPYFYWIQALHFRD